MSDTLTDELIEALEMWEGAYVCKTTDLPQRDRKLADAYQRWRRTRGVNDAR